MFSISRILTDILKGKGLNRINLKIKMRIKPIFRHEINGCEKKDYYHNISSI